MASTDSGGTMAAYLAEEWRPALGCTEPACIAYAVSMAAAQAGGPIEAIDLVCDPRMYKNCFAVGIPHSGHKVGLRWAIALGALLPDPSARLEIFRQIGPEALASAQELIQSGAIRADVDPSKQRLFVDCVVRRQGGSGRATIEGDHTRLVRLERDGVPVSIPSAAAGGDAGCWRKTLAGTGLAQVLELARTIGSEERAALRSGIELNMAIARHGTSLLPERFIRHGGEDAPIRAGRLVCAGVYARMWGEDFCVMSLAGSGNKGITCAVPLMIWGEEIGAPAAHIEEALAVACLVTSATTHHLGTLSAVCGCANAAGVGLAAGLVYLEGGDASAVSLAVTNMVGNVAGMVCDGAKIGCAMKTMTAVDAAFRSAFLALSGVGIPETDGIVGHDGISSLRNLGRVAGTGMASMDAEILDIMRAKMAHPRPDADPVV